MLDGHLNNFGIICKGRSILDLPEIEKNFDTCYIVNNFENELFHFEAIFKKKKIIHFVNRISTAVLKRETYKYFKINDIQMATPFNLFDKNFMKSYLTYKYLRLKVATMSKDVLHKFHYTGNNDYKYKFPNTGIFSILFASEVLKVKNIYIVGLDFYKDNYLYKTKTSNPVEITHQRFINLKITEFFLDYIEKKKNTNFFLRTNYKFLYKPKNLILI